MIIRLKQYEVEKYYNGGFIMGLGMMLVGIGIMGNATIELAQILVNMIR